MGAWDSWGLGLGGGKESMRSAQTTLWRVSHLVKKFFILWGKKKSLGDGSIWVGGHKETGKRPVQGFLLNTGAAAPKSAL